MLYLLGDATRMTGPGYAAKMDDILYNSSVYEWNGPLRNDVLNPMPSEARSFGAIGTTLVNLVFHETLARRIIEVVVYGIIGREDADWLCNSY
jgi:hypothetical protein